MTNPVDVVRNFYAALSSGDAATALGLLAADVDWNTMWHYKVVGRGPQAVAEGLFAPLMAEWSTFGLAADSFVAEGNQVVSLGRFTGIHGTSGKAVDAG